MNQKLSDWASLAEIVSAIAVVVTLIFLIAGIRDNTELTRASMFDSSMDSLNEIRLLIASDAEVARIWRAYREKEFDSLDDTGKTQAGELVMAMFGIYEKAYYAREYEVIGSREWERFEIQICIQLDRAQASREVLELVRITLTPSFMSYVRELCQG